MALETKLKLRSINIYQVFLRRHTKDGTILSLIDDLPRIKALGMNVIYLMPIHLSENDNEKGLKESLSAIKNYKEIDPVYGTLEDFKLLIEKANDLELKVMLDMVFHHCSYDSVIANSHPNWALKENGIPKRKLKDITGVVDLDFSQDDLHDYLIDILLYWTDLGVSAFRFDSASLIPLNFWLKAREAVLKRNPDVFFLGESSKLNFIKELRDQSFEVLSDGELYQAFDIIYDYDINDFYESYLKDSKKLNDWLKSILRQESFYPKNFVKLRSLENHETDRIANRLQDFQKLLNMTALLAFLKGAMLIYAGQEYGVRIKENIHEFEKTDLTEENKELKNLLHRISHLRKDNLFQKGNFNVHFQECEVAVISYENKMSIAYGIFNLGNVKKEISLKLKDGIYQNILYPNQVKVNGGKFKLTEKPMILFAMKKKI